MPDQILTVEIAAQQLGLHPKTVRKHIQSGKLKAKKIGREWRILSSDLFAFIGKEKSESVDHISTDELKPESVPNSGAGLRSKKAGTSNPVHEKIQVTAIIDVFVQNRKEADRLSDSLLAVVNGKDPGYGPVRVDHIFYEIELKERFIVRAGARFTGELLTLLSKISE